MRSFARLFREHPLLPMPPRLQFDVSKRAAAILTSTIGRAKL
jgi:hypothetical protein